MTQSKIFIYGKHAVEEALRYKPESVTKVYLAPTFDDGAILTLIKKTRVEILPLKANSGPQVEGNGSHQGVMASISLAALVTPYETFIKNLAVTPNTGLVLLGEVQDPHNVGAIIRSAAAFGLSGVLMPEHNQAPVTGTVAKVSAGMAFRVPLVSIGNVNTTVRDLKAKGFWIYGLEGEADHSLHDEKFDAPAVFIVGNEGAGIRMKTKEVCDILLSIPVHPRCESLNAAASAAVALYSWSAQHPSALN